MLEADLQYLAVIAYEPTIVWIRKCNGPEAAHIGQHIPSAPFIGSPSRFPGREIRLRLGGDYNGAIVLMTNLVVLSAPIAVIFVVASAADIGQAENRALHRRFVRQGPRLAAVV